MEEREKGEEEVALVECNPVNSGIAGVRHSLMKAGIAALLTYNGSKAVVVGTVAYMAYLGIAEEKLIAAGAAGMSLLAASPTFWLAGGLITAKISAQVSKAFPKP